MSINISQSTQFKIRNLKLITKLGIQEIGGIYQELNIYDSMFMPCMRGDILIQDAIGLASKLTLDGSEYITMEISKADEPANSATVINKTFRIYKLGNRSNLNQNSELYILYFISEEMIYSMQKKINQSFKGIYSEIAKKVLNDILQVPVNKIGIIDDTKGIHNVVIPSLSPFDTLEWLIKRSVSNENLPNLFFFENKYGYNFASLSTLVKLPVTTNINFEPKNIGTLKGEEFYGARDMSLNSQFDLMENISNGVYAGKFIGIDPLMRKVSTAKIDYLQTYARADKHLNKNPNFTSGKNREDKDAAQMYDSKVSLYAFQTSRDSSDWIKTNEVQTGKIIDDTHSYVFQRAPILTNLMQTTIHLNVPGNFAFTSGTVVNLKMPSRAAKTDKDNVDNTLNGKYIITAARHIIKGDIHETVIEVVTDSTNKPFTTNQSTDMVKAVKR